MSKSLGEVVVFCACVSVFLIAVPGYGAWDTYQEEGYTEEVECTYEDTGDRVVIDGETHTVQEERCPIPPAGRIQLFGMFSVFGTLAMVGTIIHTWWEAR